MTMLRHLFAVLTGLILLVPSSASELTEVFSFVENGDRMLSFNHDEPTDLGMFLPGINSVTGQVEPIGDFFEFDLFEPEERHMARTADIFTFEIPQGAELDSIVLNDFSTQTGANAFFALDDGNQFFYSPLQLNVQETPYGEILAGDIAGTDHVGMDILQIFRTLNVAGGSGVTPPLGAGQYTMYIQETMGNSSYSLGFNVSAVPEAGSLALMSTAAIGGGAICLRRRRRGKRPVA